MTGFLIEIRMEQIFTFRLNHYGRENDAPKRCHYPSPPWTSKTILRYMQNGGKDAKRTELANQLTFK